MGAKIDGLPTFCVSHGWGCETDEDGFCSSCGNDAQGEAVTETTARIAALEAALNRIIEIRATGLRISCPDCDEAYGLKCMHGIDHDNITKIARDALAARAGKEA